MRNISWTNAFKKDFKKHGTFTGVFIEAVWRLANDEPLPERFCDHPLQGEWETFRDCHIRPDLILIYKKPDKETLKLVRLASHSELGF